MVDIVSVNANTRQAPENQNSPFERKRENQNNIYEAWQVVWF